MKDIKDEIAKILKEEFLEQEMPGAEMQAAAPVAKPAPVQTTIVNFNKGREDAFSVKFSQRGFSVEGTRLNYELLDLAISKDFNITLDNGKGLALDPIKMEQILKYRDQF